MQGMTPSPSDSVGGVGLSNTLSADKNGTAVESDLFLGDGRIAYAGVQGNIPIPISSNDKPAYSLGTMTADVLALGVSVDLNSAVVPIGLNFFIGGGFGDEKLKIETPAPAAVIANVKQDWHGNRKIEGLVDQITGGAEKESAPKPNEGALTDGPKYPRPLVDPNTNPPPSTSISPAGNFGSGDCD